MKITTSTLSFEPVRSTCAVQLYRVWVCQRSDCMTNTDETVAYGKIAFQYLQLMKFKASSDGGCILCVFPNSCNLIDTKTNKAVIISSLINLLWWSIGHHRPTRSARGTTVPTAVLSTFCSMCLRGRLWVRSYLSRRLFVFVHLQTGGCAGVKGDRVLWDHHWLELCDKLMFVCMYVPSETYSTLRSGDNCVVCLPLILKRFFFQRYAIYAIQRRLAIAHGIISS